AWASRSSSSVARCTQAATGARGCSRPDYRQECDVDGEVRVVVVDDEPLVRHGLVGILGSEPGLRVVGEGGDGADALDLARREQPDVVCLDVRMPGIDGITATQRLVRPTSDGSPTPRVLITPTFGGDEDDLSTEERRVGQEQR